MTFFSGCKSENPTAENIVGIWNANDGALIEFDVDGTFSTKDVSGDKLFSFENAYMGKVFNETGKWNIGKDQGAWVVFLYFNKSDNLPKGYSTHILVSGSKGVLENQPPWYLFLWEKEEGGPRYKFTKKNI